MRFRKLLVQILIPALLLPFTASALVMRTNGPEPVIVQIKDSLRTSDDLDNRLNELATARQQNGLGVVKWWAGRKFLVMLSFPTHFSEQQAMRVIGKLRQLAAVEKVVPVSGYNLEFKSGDFVRTYGPTDSIPDVARRGFDADRIGKRFPVPDEGTLANQAHVPNRFLVRWKEELIWKAEQTGFSQQLANFHQNSGCRVTNEFRYSPTQLTQVVEFDDPVTLADKLKRYMDTGWAVYVDPDYVVQMRNAPNDPAYAGYPGPQWSLANISAPQAWDLTTGDPSVILAVGDTGANVHTDSTGHPDFSSNLWWGQNDPSTGQHNFIYGGTNVDDDDSVNNTFHGSNVASIIGAQGNNGTAMTGVAWDTSLMILKVLPASGGTSSFSGIESAIYYAWQHGATAINLSLGTYGPYYYDCYYDNETRRWQCPTEEPYERTLVDALRQARAKDPAYNSTGMVVVCAAGNEAYNDDDEIANPDNPAGIPTANNISVMASDRYDNRATFSNGVAYSNYGRGTVDLAAPGGRDNDKINRAQAGF